MKPVSSILFVAVGSLSLFSCHDEDMAPPETPPTVVKEWSLVLSAKNEVPAAENEMAAGTAKFTLLSNNSLVYEFSVNNLATDDVLTMSHLHTGDAGSNGPVILPLATSFTTTSASGRVDGLRESLVDSLMQNSNHIYFNVHSQQSPAGIVRAQLNTTIELAMDLALSSEHEVSDPPVVIEPVVTGKALLRLTADKKLYYNITVDELGEGDELTMAHIHTGEEGANGPVYITLCDNKDDFATAKVITLSDEEYTTLKEAALYVNVHSVNHPAGVTRGQIR